MGKYIPVDPEKWGEMVKAMAEVTRLKAEVERLQHLANQSEFYRSQLQKDTCRLENIQMQDAFKHYEAENGRLKAEVERLEHQVKYWRIEAETDHARWLRVLEDVERLRKAGDNLITALDKRDDVFDNSDKRDAINDWNAAKEGKPSV